MAFELKEWRVLSILLLVSYLEYWVHGEPQVPCFFIFGDSLSDNGNNNVLATTAKANYSPYGIDYPQGPTGRFSNGRNMLDVIAELLGFNSSIPPFTNASGNDISKGLNYASGAAGIRNESGEQRGVRISMDLQLQIHQLIVSKIVGIIGNNDSAVKYLNKCLYSVGMGSNDYINNYFMPQFYNTSRQYTPDQYAMVLIQQYSQQLKTLYDYGARKVVLLGVGQLGCTPFEIAAYGTNGSSCVDNINNAVQIFNKRLISLVDDLNTNLTDAKFTYINTYGSGSANLSSYGFTVTNTSCCKVANGEDICIPNQIPCLNRTSYVFWDAVHPTEALNVLVAYNAYNTQSPTDAYPVNIHNLAQL